MKTLSSPAFRSPMFQWILRFIESILSGLIIPNFLYIFTIAGTLSIRLTFSTSFFAFTDSVTFSANSPFFVLTCDTYFFASSFVSENLLNPNRASAATMTIRSGRI